MKKISIFAITLSLAFVSCGIKTNEIYDGSNEAKVPTERPRCDAFDECDCDIMDFGEVGFTTTQTWMISGNGITQEWSAPVITSNCYKTNFCDQDGHGNFVADCRTQANKVERAKYGDLFSWVAVVQYGDVLCPDEWRVPTREDFRDLDIALGGPGNKGYIPRHVDKYLIDWGGGHGDNWSRNGKQDYDYSASYWSQSESNARSGYGLYFISAGHVDPQSSNLKNVGRTLRCVR